MTRFYVIIALRQRCHCKTKCKTNKRTCPAVVGNVYNSKCSLCHVRINITQAFKYNINIINEYCLEST